MNCNYFWISLYLIVHVESVESDNKALETRHVCVWALPGEQERMRTYMTQLKTADRRQRTQFRVFDSEKITVQDGCWFGALRAHFGASFLGREPFSMLPQPDLLHVGLARANQRVAYEDRKKKWLFSDGVWQEKKAFFLHSIQFFKRVCVCISKK